LRGGNPARNENLERAAELDRNLRELWSKHPNFVFVPHHTSFMKKVTMGLEALQQAVNKLPV